MSKAVWKLLVVALAIFDDGVWAFCPLRVNPTKMSRRRFLYRASMPDPGDFMLAVSRQESHHAPQGRIKCVQKWRRNSIASLAGFLAVAFVSRPALAAGMAKTTISPSRLGTSNVFAAASILISLAVIPLAGIFGASNLARGLLLSASRCSLQVFLLGSVVLNQMMAVRSPALVAIWIFLVGSIAGNEAFSRIQFTYPKMRRHVYTSVLSGGWTVLALTLGLRMLGAIEPWYQPRTWIPVAGMLFGNTLSAIALGASAITKDFATRRDSVEFRLARGATWREATSPLILDALLTALTPTINSLAVTGLVHIPGMMTGQILAGQSMSQAAMYQIVISFLIATTACTTVQLLMRSAVGALVDAKNHRLRQDVLSSKPDRNLRPQHKSLRVVWRDAFRPKAGRQISSRSSTIPPMLQTALPRRLEGATSRQGHSSALLKAEALVVPRAMASVSFSLHPGDRIGITGRSGVGKSQVLRSIAALEESPAGTLQFNGVSIDDIDPPGYRTQVCLVPQRIPTLQGTPQDLYDEILKFKHQKRGKTGHTDSQSPKDIAKEWGISNKLFQQEWLTLSGGEAQRISLAIAVSLQPEVLLLDESLSALDEATARSVEATLLKRKIPIIMVTHSNVQLQRFCTHHIALTPNGKAFAPTDQET